MQEVYVWVAVVAVMASLVGAFDYLRIVKLMYFDDLVDDAPIESARTTPGCCCRRTACCCCCLGSCRSR